MAVVHNFLSKMSVRKCIHYISKIEKLAKQVYERALSITEKVSLNFLLKLYNVMKIFTFIEA